MILFYIVCKNKKEASLISKGLLDKKLVACTNYFDINSMYTWKKKIANGKECALIAKTTEKNKKSIEKEVLKMHSYSVPCILSFEANANRAYLKWLENQVKK